VGDVNRVFAVGRFPIRREVMTRRILGQALKGKTGHASAVGRTARIKSDLLAILGPQKKSKGEKIRLRQWGATSLLNWEPDRPSPPPLLARPGSNHRRLPVQLITPLREDKKQGRSLHPKHSSGATDPQINFSVDSPALRKKTCGPASSSLA